MPIANVPTFSASGKRLRNYTRAALEALAREGKVAVELNRKRLIVCATFRPSDGANPILKTAHMGQHYSYAQHLPSGHRAWTHSPLIDKTDLGNEDVEAVETFVRAVFRRVQSSTTVTEKSPRLAPVISIDTYRGKQKRLAPVISIEVGRRRLQARKTAGAVRPIEFDSERRAA